MPESRLQKIKSLLTAGPPEPGPGPRDGVLPEMQLHDALKETLAGSKFSSGSRDLIRALVLLWHDHLDAAHVIAQDVENRDGSFVHGIMHRREPDYSNAKYWFRRVEGHPCYPEIARRVADWLGANGGDELRAKIVPGGQWDAFAFIDACEAAARSPAGAKQRRMLSEVQRIETETLLEHLISHP